MKSRPSCATSLAFAFLACAGLSSTRALAAIDRSTPSQELPSHAQAHRPRWMLNSFLQLSAHDPDRLLRIGFKLFSGERLRITSLEPAYAYEWQHRLAMVSALSDFFDPTGKGRKTRNPTYRARARELIRRAMLVDPSLLVRDGAVESVRRILRMQPGERNIWKKSLEQAFLQPKNIMGGEGFFIRETILTALHESAIEPSRRVRQAAAHDKNQQVQRILRSWNTSSFDEL
jgi:hypothetical protein